LHDDEATNAYRLFHGWQEGCHGLEIDRYGAAALVSYKSHVTDVDQAFEVLAELHDFEVIVAKPRGGEPVAVRGSVPEGSIEVREHGLRFVVEPWRPGNPGLFLDARAARAWIRANAAGRRVLNLFSFSGSLGVAAAAGGALSVTHVDMQRGSLERCRANHRLNGLALDDRDLMRANVYQHLRKSAAGRRRFGAVIMDPPPITPSQHSDRTPGGRGLATLAPLAARMLAPDGWMLCFFHRSSHRDASDRSAREAEVLAAAERPLEIMWRGESGPDFPESEPGYKLMLTAFRAA
jgi:23S rRNA (cytosine1962-C5)-methyltransferase